MWHLGCSSSCHLWAARASYIFSTASLKKSFRTSLTFDDMKPVSVSKRLIETSNSLMFSSLGQALVQCGRVYFLLRDGISGEP